MPISSHCFWPCESSPRGRAAPAPSGRSVSSISSMRSRCAPSSAPNSDARHAAVGRQRQLEVLEHRVVLEHRRPLELAADAEPRRSRTRAGAVSSMRRADRSTRPASGRVLPVMTSISVVLPAPFGPMMQRSSPASSTSVSVVERLEAVEADADVVDPEDGAVRARRAAPGSTMRRQLAARPPGAALRQRRSRRRLGLAARLAAGAHQVGRHDGASWPRQGAHARMLHQARRALPAGTA